MWDVLLHFYGARCARMSIPRYFLLARAVTARTQPAGARGFDPSVIDARAWLHGRACLSFTRTRTHVRTGAQSIHPSSICLSRVKSERKLLPVTDRWKQLWFRCDISKENRIHAFSRPHHTGICILQFSNRLLRICAFCPLQLQSYCTSGVSHICYPPPTVYPTKPRLSHPFCSPCFSIISCRAAIRSGITRLCVRARASAAGAPASSRLCAWRSLPRTDRGNWDSELEEWTPPCSLLFLLLLHSNQPTHTHTHTLFQKHNKIKHFWHWWWFSSSSVCACGWFNSLDIRLAWAHCELNF